MNLPNALTVARLLAIPLLWRFRHVLARPWPPPRRSERRDADEPAP